ncbi:hypothetical protein QC761_0042970 [Podospora bellae-mahoneyi]|uniref:Uncharacterized protein n=1 Tax=Podospora bellae-mahoneyi TaxID=2093777 RepID=A0ABR0FR67_9PEZI|nr:hypothetical protein QC761_0042970 [Podospora bellae-mahoneyi]
MYHNLTIPTRLQYFPPPVPLAELHPPSVGLSNISPDLDRGIDFFTWRDDASSDLCASHYQPPRPCTSTDSLPP